MLCESCTEKGDSTVSRLWKMDMVVDKLQFRNHVDQWCKPNCNPHNRNELHRVSVCLSVCQSVHRYHLAFLGGVVGEGLTCDCEGNRLNSNDRSMWWA